MDLGYMKSQKDIVAAIGKKMITRQANPKWKKLGNAIADDVWGTCPNQCNSTSQTSYMSYSRICIEG